MSFLCSKWNSLQWYNVISLTSIPTSLLQCSSYIDLLTFLQIARNMVMCRNFALTVHFAWSTFPSDSCTANFFCDYKVFSWASHSITLRSQTLFFSYFHLSISTTFNFSSLSLFPMRVGILCVCVLVTQVAQLCPALCDTINCSLPGSSVHGILQARILEWVATPFSRWSFRPRDWIQALQADSLPSEPPGNPVTTSLPVAISQAPRIVWSIVDAQ